MAAVIPTKLATTRTDQQLPLLNACIAEFQPNDLSKPRDKRLSERVRTIVDLIDPNAR